MMNSCEKIFNTSHPSRLIFFLLVIQIQSCINFSQLKQKEEPLLNLNVQLNVLFFVLSFAFDSFERLPTNNYNLFHHLQWKSLKSYARYFVASFTSLFSITSSETTI